MSAPRTARQQGKSLNAMVGDYLGRLAGRQGGKNVANQFGALWSERSGRSGGWRFNRREVYEDR